MGGDAPQRNGSAAQPTRAILIAAAFSMRSLRPAGLPSLFSPPDLALAEAVLSSPSAVAEDVHRTPAV